MYVDTLETELGGIILAGTATALCALDFEDCRERMTRLLERGRPGVVLEPKKDFGGFASRLRFYLGGDLQALDGVQTDSKGTNFEQTVWRLLRQIEPGTTASYGQLAARLGKPGAARAVGRANSLNPIALVIPCHRVIGSDGSLTGYAGGVHRKKWLLEHEGCRI